jgi:c(7)-type cytochrome triheme protein
MKARLSVSVLAAAWLIGVGHAGAQDKSPKAVYESSCAGCHGTGVLGAPKLGDAAMWGPRAKAGIDALVKSAIAGTPKGMPPKGGRADLDASQLRAVIEYMMSGGAAPKVVAAAPVAKAAPAKAESRTETKAEGRAAPAAAAKAAAPVTSAADAPPSAPAAPAAAVAPAVPAAAQVAAPAAAERSNATAQAAAPNPAPSAEVNAFNRLLKPSSRANRPAVDSGIHDPANDMTLQLQPPSVAFADLPKSFAGNHVDWVKSLDSRRIAPRWDRFDPAAPAVVMDLNIVREVKGSMPDVVYPHKQHTEWLDCSNCHPAIFVPQKGANQISMASILLGQQCGVCHGKVAFPVSECRLCHSKKKTEAVIAGERKP